MSGERPKVSVVEIGCVAVGVFIGLMTVRFVFGLEGMLGGALGGAIGAALGLAIFRIISKTN